jgi:hypothetical protein
MRRTKRLSIEFRHREVTVTVEGPVLYTPTSAPTPAHPSSACPTCGGQWITIIAQIVGDAPANTDTIYHALQQSGLHLQISPAGELKICQKSFEAIKETL